jgi:hypothetical protein
MRIVLVKLLLLALALLALTVTGAAHEDGGEAAAEAAADTGDPERIDFEAGCLTVPCGACEIDQVNIAITCCKDKCSCCPEGFDATLRVEFLGADNEVLTIGDVKGRFCDICEDKEYMAKLSQSVCPQDINGARVSLFDGPEHGINVECMVIRVRDPYGRLGVCDRWHKVFKCCIPCCQQLGGGTDWFFSVDKCGCSKCTSCGCKQRCTKSCGSCNKCAKKSCGCKARCDKPAKTMPACKCQKCSGGCQSKCGGCNDKCGCKSKCGCNKCAKKSCGCKGKCDKCESKCKPGCGCSKCKPSCGGCGKCDSCKSSGGCGCKF